MLQARAHQSAVKVVGVNHTVHSLEETFKELQSQLDSQKFSFPCRPEHLRLRKAFGVEAKRSEVGAIPFPSEVLGFIVGPSSLNVAQHHSRMLDLLELGNRCLGFVQGSELLLDGFQNLCLRAGNVTGEQTVIVIKLFRIFRSSCLLKHSATNTVVASIYVKVERVLTRSRAFQVWRAKGNRIGRHVLQHEERFFASLVPPRRPSSTVSIGWRHGLVHQKVLGSAETCLCLSIRHAVSQPRRVNPIHGLRSSRGTRPRTFPFQSSLLMKGCHSLPKGFGNLRKSRGQVMSEEAETGKKLFHVLRPSRPWPVLHCCCLLRIRHHHAEANLLTQKVNFELRKVTLRKLEAQVRSSGGSEHPVQSSQMSLETLGVIDKCISRAKAAVIQEESEDRVQLHNLRVFASSELSLHRSKDVKHHLLKIGRPVLDTKGHDRKLFQTHVGDDGHQPCGFLRGSQLVEPSLRIKSRLQTLACQGPCCAEDVPDRNRHRLRRIVERPEVTDEAAIGVILFPNDVAPSSPSTQLILLRGPHLAHLLILVDVHLLLCHLASTVARLRLLNWLRTRFQSNVELMSLNDCRPTAINVEHVSVLVNNFSQSGQLTGQQMCVPLMLRIKLCSDGSTVSWTKKVLILVLRCFLLSAGIDPKQLGAIHTLGRLVPH